MVLGSGMGAFAAPLNERVAAGDLGLPEPSVAGHRGEVAVGTVEGRRVVALSGRVHLYEGHDAATVVLAVRAMARWGVRGLVLTSAVGGLVRDWRAGTIVVVTDHLNLMGTNPLVGPNIDALGPRFPDQGAVYPAARRALAQRVGAERAIGGLAEGIYAALRGPSYETPAEVRMLQRLGADVVGMSLVPEAMAANHAGMEVLALAVVANPAAGLAEAPLAHAEVTAAMAAAATRVVSMVSGVVAAW